MYAIMVIDEAIDFGILDKEYYLESRNVAERMDRGRCQGGRYETIQISRASKMP